MNITDRTPAVWETADPPEYTGEDDAFCQRVAELSIAGTDFDQALAKAISERGAGSAHWLTRAGAA